MRLRAAAVVPPIVFAGELSTNTPAWPSGTALVPVGSVPRKSPSIVLPPCPSSTIALPPWNPLTISPWTMLSPPVITRPSAVAPACDPLISTYGQPGVARLTRAVDDHRSGDVGQGRQRLDDPVRFREVEADDVLAHMAVGGLDRFSQREMGRIRHRVIHVVGRVDREHEAAWDLGIFTATENSEVSLWLAVAVMKAPGATVTGKLTSNWAAPFESVETMVVPRNVCPSP